MTRIVGEALDRTWSRIEPVWRETLAMQLGEAVRQIHEISPPLQDVTASPWSTFLVRQRDQCVNRQQQCGLSKQWLDQIPQFIDRVYPKLLEMNTLCLVHSELLREHVFVRNSGDSWELVGLIDFEQARFAVPEYEFAAVAIFIAAGDTSVLQAFCRGYYLAARKELFEREVMMAFALLHEQSNLQWFIEQTPAASNIQTLSELSNLWWPGEHFCGRSSL
jgi:hygromycin-B 7''-O-kinase